MERQDTLETFRERLLDVIERAGLSRSGFARKVGIDRSTLSQILSPATDRLPRVETLTAIAVSEQVSIDWLVGLSQEGGLQADIMHQEVEFEVGGRLPSDDLLATWHAEAIGYKIRYVPSTIPDLLKTDVVIDHEYRPSAVATPEQRRETAQEKLAYQRRPETDQEVCSPLQTVESLARGEGIWQGLSIPARKEQLLHMIKLSEELYPTFRWFMFDGLSRYSAPLTIFGPLRVVIYLGQMYLVLNSREHIKVITTHFDALIRAAVVQPTEVPNLLRRLYETL
jgi:transcriptional regulator with XRE-family HTH domain